MNELEIKSSRRYPLDRTQIEPNGLIGRSAINR